MSLRDNRSMATSKAVALLLVAISFLLSASPVPGQIVNATLYGAVTDPTGAGVPEASVTDANVSTGIATRTTSDSTGAYTLPSLAPGSYTLTVEKTGFKSTVISGITLLVNQQAQVDARLQVGGRDKRSGAAGLNQYRERGHRDRGARGGGAAFEPTPVRLSRCPRPRHDDRQRRIRFSVVRLTLQRVELRRERCALRQQQHAD